MKVVEDHVAGGVRPSQAMVRRQWSLELYHRGASEIVRRSAEHAPRHKQATRLPRPFHIPASSGVEMTPQRQMGFR